MLSAPLLDAPVVVGPLYRSNSTKVGSDGDSAYECGTGDDNPAHDADWHEDEGFGEGCNDITWSVLREASIDSRHIDTMNLWHHIITTITGRLHRAPLKHPQRAIDIGTGTGTWAIDFADENPGCEVMGNDISSFQPVMVPPNLEFVTDDFEDSWEGEDERHDFVHMRNLNESIRDLPGLLARAYRSLKPGGYIESCESALCIGTVDTPSPSAEWLCPLFKAALDGVESSAMETTMTTAGFVNVKETTFEVPVSIQHGYIGTLALEYLNNFIWCAADLWGWPKDEAIVYSAQFRKEILASITRCYFKVKIVWGQKETS